MSKINIKLNNNNFQDLVDKLQDLSQIDDTIKIKIEKDKTLIYSMISNDVSVLALKSYTINTLDYFENFKEDGVYDFVITSSAKFVKNLKFFDTKKPIKLNITFKQAPDSDDIFHVRSAQFTNDKLKISCVGGEQYKIRDINSKFLSKILNIKNSIWKFKIDKSDFSNIKKLSTINNEDKVIYINVSGGKVIVNEPAKWELEVDETNHKNDELIFNKKYLSNINDDSDEIEFIIFQNFILCKDTGYNLMLSFETNFNSEE